MAIKKWEFIKKPTEKWPQRLEVNVISDSKDDIILLLEKYNGAYGTIMPAGDDNSYKFYLYDGSEKEIKRLDNIFKGKEEKEEDRERRSEVKEQGAEVESEKLEEEKEESAPKEEGVVIERFEEKKNLDKHAAVEIKKIINEKDNGMDSRLRGNGTNIEKKRKILRIIKLGIIYHKEDEMIEIKAGKSSQGKEIKIEQFVFEKMKEVVEGRNINIDFEEGFKLSYRNEKDFANLNELIFKDKTDALVIITRKGNNSKFEELFNDLGISAYFIDKKVVAKQYKYLNIVMDMALK